jgi:hypothetical protein
VEPHEVQPLADLTPAAWLERGITGFDGLVRNVLPPSFDCYVRLEETDSVSFLDYLARALKGHTTTPDSCWFAIWDGWPLSSAWRSAPRFHLPHRAYLLFRGGLADVATLSIEFACGGIEPEGSAVLHGLGRVAGEADYGQAAQAMRAQGEYCFAPSLWWPQDRAWVVAREVDADSTYIAGTCALGDKLVLDSPVNATHVAPDDAVTVD